MRLIFWISVGLLLYTYGVYPLVLIVLASLKQLTSDLRFGLTRRPRRVSRDTADCPRVSIVFAAHNEEAVIARKMLNCARLNYPARSLEILVGCDGCTDATAAFARVAAPPNVSVYRFADRCGKPHINKLLLLAHNEIWCSATRTPSSSLMPFGLSCDISGGPRSAVSAASFGCDRATATRPANSCTGDMRRCSSFSKARLNMLVGANGALFGIRRSLFAAIPMTASRNCSSP